MGSPHSVGVGDASSRICSEAILSICSLSSSVGPLHSDLEYTVSSQKEGYVLTAVEGTIGDFNAYALAGVSFEIKAEDDQPLPGVLLSLSGGVFRSNLLTQDNGILTFSNLVRCPVTACPPHEGAGAGMHDCCVA